MKNLDKFVINLAEHNNIDPRTLRGWAITEKPKYLEPGMLAYKYNDDWIVMYYVGYWSKYRHWAREHYIYEERDNPDSKIRPPQNAPLSYFVKQHDAPCIQESVEELYEKYIVPAQKRTRRIRKANKTRRFELPDGTRCNSETYERYLVLKGVLMANPDLLRQKRRLSEITDIPYNSLIHICSHLSDINTNTVEEEL